MKLTLDDKFLYVSDASSEEIKWLDKKLTWEDDYDKTISEKLLFREGEKIYTFWGISNLIKNHMDCPYDVEIIGTVETPTNKGVNVKNDILEGITLMDFQVAAVKKSIVLKKGISSIPTGGGKTEIMCAVLRYLLTHNMMKSAVIVVPSVGLAEQFIERAFKRGFTNDEISLLHGNSEFKNTPIMVGVINSITIAMNKNNDIGKFIKNTDVLMYDEAHHASANSYLRVAIDTTPEYLLMYSASPFNSKNIMENSSNVLLYGLTGNIVYSITQKYLRELGLIAEPVLFYKVIPGRMAKYQGRYHDIYNANIVKSVFRNNVITNYADKFTKLGFKTLILVQRIEHAKALMISLKQHKVTCIFGGATGLQIDEFGMIEEYVVDYNMFRSNFEAGLYDIVIMSQVGDEGFDIGSINVVVLAGGGKSRIKLLQRVGRGLRRKKVGPNKVYIVDFYDKTHVFLASQYRKRRLLMEEVEAKIIENEFEFFQEAINHSLELKNLLKEIAKLSDKSPESLPS